jgi:hypothetical protein
LLSPEDLEMTNIESQHLYMLQNFMDGGDFAELSSLCLQVQITMRVMKHSSDNMADSTRETVFSSIKMVHAMSDLHNEDHRHNIFGYPNSFTDISENFVETEILIEEKNFENGSFTLMYKKYIVSLALPVFSYLFKHQKDIDILIGVLVNSDVTGQQKKFLHIADDEAVTDYTGVKIPTRWLTTVKLI